jgi:L-ascorbate metabolism protein UlaG (beta-lactamase superfamily)
MKKFFLIISTLMLLCALWLLAKPSMSEIGIAYAQHAEDGQALTVTWFGVTTLLIDDGVTQILIDGYFSRPSLLDIALERRIEPDLAAIKDMLDRFEINRLKAVIPVHSHFDHALDSAEIAKQTGAQLMGSTTTAQVAAGSNLATHQVSVIETKTVYPVGAFEVTFYPSKHAPLATNSAISGTVAAPLTLPAPYTAWKLGRAYTLVIAHPKGRMLIQGSAGFVPGALAEIEVDAVFLGTGGLPTLPRAHQLAYLDEMVTQRQPKRVYTIHHDDLFGDLGNVEQNVLMPNFDQTQAFELGQQVLPAQLLQMQFGVPINL